MNKIRLFRRVVGLCLTCIFMFFLYQTITHKLTRIVEFSLYPNVFASIQTLFGMIIWNVIGEIAWEWLLRKVCFPDMKLKWSITGEAFFKSALARYTPGRIWQALLRAELLAKHQIPRSDTIRSVLYEQINFMGATIIYALILSPFFLTHSIGNMPVFSLLLILICAAILVSLWLCVPQEVINIVNSVCSTITRKKMFEPLKIRGTILHWQIGMLLFFLLVLLQGVILYPIIQDIISIHVTLTFTQWIMVIGAYPIARLLGQFAVIFPAGLVVREGVYILLLMPLIGSNRSSIIAVWSRLLQVFSEIIMYVIFSWKSFRRLDFW